MRDEYISGIDERDFFMNYHADPLEGTKYAEAMQKAVIMMMEKTIVPETSNSTGGGILPRNSNSSGESGTCFIKIEKTHC